MTDSSPSTQNPAPTSTPASASTQPAPPASSALDPANPFAQPSSLPYGLPDFAAIREEHYAPAARAGMAEQLATVRAIVADPEPPTAQNTLDVLESGDRVLHRSLTAFFNRLSADASPGLEELEAELGPELSAHRDAIYQDRGLYERLAALQARAEAGQTELEPDAAWLLHEQLRTFRRAGIELDDAGQARLREINARLASLQAEFGRKLLAGEKDAAVLVTDEAELAGLPDDAVAGARQAAAERGEAGWLLQMQLPTHQDVVTSLEDPAVRERVQRASEARGARGDDNDTRAVVVEVARLRAEQAALLGYAHYADYVAADGTARTGDAVAQMLAGLVPPATANARREATELAAALEAAQPGAVLRASDWSFVSERLRAERFDFDAAALRPYLELERVVHEGVFRAAHELYGLSFVERTDLVGYHPDVRVFEVFDDGDDPQATHVPGEGLGLFLADWFTRPSKRGGAWMNNLVDQSHLLGEQPVVVNNLNLVKPPAGSPALLDWDNVITLFHEFGHALHGLLSDVRYPSQSGTAVPRDFVEYPSQVNEMWAWEPSILRSYAVHHETGEALPDHLVDALLGTRLWNEGFATTEYLGATLLDQAWHRLTPDEVPASGEDVLGFEQRALADAGVALEQVPPRYRTTYFNHVFGGGYAAGYYSYIWSEVLDADTVEWFHENGGLRRENGDRFRAALLARGGSQDPMVSFAQLRGRAPDVAPLLVRRGLASPEA